MDWTLELVPMPVTDVDRAKALYADQIGFEVITDRQVSYDQPGGRGVCDHLGMLLPDSSSATAPLLQIGDRLRARHCHF